MHQQEPDCGQYDAPEWDKYTSGPGRTSGPASHSRRDGMVKPGYRDRREDSRDRRGRKDRYRRDSYRREEPWSDESSGRDGRRNYGAERAKTHSYRKGT